MRPSAITLDRCTYEPLIKSDPFSPMCLIPMPNPFNGEPETEPAFITKRNERERERVRCVNDGYARLRTHIPLENKEKRISKVETLRAAIQYIKELENILAKDPAERPNVKTQHEKKSNHVTRIKGRREHEHSRRFIGQRRKVHTSDKK